MGLFCIKLLFSFTGLVINLWRSNHRTVIVAVREKNGRNDQNFVYIAKTPFENCARFVGMLKQVL